MKKATALSTLVLFALLPGAARAQAAGGVHGTVKLTKAPPKKEARKVTKDNSTCGSEKEDETYVVGSGGALANVVVFLEGVKGGSAPASADLDQQKCRYVPHVLAVAKGATVNVKNSDPILHNTHSYLGGSTVFNMALPVQGMKIPKKLDKAGAVKLGCDAGHTWMAGWIYVADSGFITVTDKSGRFSLEGVPPGEYTLKTWHEAEGEKSAKVTIAAGAAADVSITY